MKKAVAVIALIASASALVYGAQATQPASQSTQSAPGVEPTQIISATATSPNRYVLPYARNCANEGDLAENVAEHTGAVSEGDRLREARSEGNDLVYAANIRAIFENKDLAFLSGEAIADLAEKACNGGGDLSAYKAP